MGAVSGRIKVDRPNKGEQSLALPVLIYSPHNTITLFGVVCGGMLLVVWL